MNEQMQQRQAQTLTDGVGIWDSGQAMSIAVRMAEYLANARIIPQQYQKNPGDCLVAIDLGRRMGLSPVTVMQNSQMVRGNFSWKGSFCKALVDMSGRFDNSRYEFIGKPGEMNWGCRMVAENRKTHRTVHGPYVTIQMAKDEGWLSKDGSKWKTMPELMMRYRAAAFFARTECPEVLSGFHTAEEIIDVGPLKVIDEEEQRADNAAGGEIYDAPAALEREQYHLAEPEQQDAPQEAEQVSLDDI